MDNSIIEKRKNQKKLYFKITFILFLILLLIIPNSLTHDLIRERKGLEYQVQREIAQNWGPSQKIMGPVLSIPYTTFNKDGTIYARDILRVLPNKSKIDVTLSTEKRSKSIYSTILYGAKNNIKSSFTIPTKSDFNDQQIEILWDEANIDIGFTSAASIDQKVIITWNDIPYPMKSGASEKTIFRSGIHADIKIDPSISEYSFETNIAINGSEKIEFLPLASNTIINMESPWKDPGFIGMPLPKKREISNAGFTAEWKTTEYNRPFKSIWTNNQVLIENFNSSFGVNLIQTVGHYQKNMRCSKYAILIIGLSFMVFFFYEMIKGNNIHPIQYIFVGLSLSVFYLLLLSFSEHVGFDIAYFIATIAVVSLITWYSRYLLQGSANVIVLYCILSSLYGYIYTLLQMEEFALIVGSIGLFSALGIAMYLTRNMNWYDLSGSIKNQSKVENITITV
ncbi:MAG: cell envelope integrity protein CreD [Saprospiraceae bacterium]